MIAPRSRSWCLRRALVRLAFLFASVANSSFATGYYGPSVYLDEGGRRVTGSPEFFWELEVKRLSREFRPLEQSSAHAVEPVSDGTDEPKKVTLSRMATLDEMDFQSALDEGRIKPPNATEAIAQHKAARAAIEPRPSATLPPEFESEFADYHHGAFAYARGAEHWDEARQAWETLLARPPEERHYRSVWAAFMLGRLALKNLDPEASTWFQRTRALVKEGFNDSLDLVADSYGWEGRSEWKHNHPEKAAQLYLTQLALGDESAVISLKALIPDRMPVEGLLNYGPELDERGKWNDAEKRAQEEKELAGLKTAARDPLMRRLVTVHILATQADPFISEDTGRPSARRAARWLAAIQETKNTKIADSEYLGWIAYGDGKYDQAGRWLALSSGDTPAALWLKSKLQLRAGKVEEATRTMAKAWETLHNVAAYTGWEFWKDADSSAESFDDGEHWPFEQSASGDLGGLRLSRAEFVGALDAFWKGKLLSDAAFMAERVLTVDELKKYVDAQPFTAEDAAAFRSGVGKLRYMLGRRLVREDRYAEAAPYLPPEYAKRLEVYVKALNDGVSPQLSKMERARAYFKAAWIARYDGMELMGTDGAPDGFLSEGSFPEVDLAQQRRSGSYVRMSYDATGDHRANVLISLKPNAKEKERLTKQRIRPDVRFHYRVVATALAMKAAELLPDNSKELADVLNSAGPWSDDRDQKLAERCVAMIEKRAAKTEIGRAVAAKHRFTDQTGPWSSAEEEEREAERKADEKAE